MRMWRNLKASPGDSSERSGRTSSLRTSASRLRPTAGRRSSSRARPRPPARTPGRRRSPARRPRARAGSSRSSRADSSALIDGRDADLARVARGASTRRRSPRRRSPSSTSMREHLLDEQRVALGGGQDPRRELGVGSAVAAGQARRSAGSSRRAASGSSRIVVAFSLAVAPARPLVEQLRAGRAEQEDRRVAAPVGDVLDAGRAASARPSGCPRR